MDTTDIVWGAVAKAVTYQLKTPSGWVNVTRNVYATIRHSTNRRIILRNERKIINDEIINI